MGISIDPLSIVAIVIIMGIAAWGIRMLKNRLDEQRYMEEMAEMEFTESLLAESAISGEGQDLAFKLQDIDRELISPHIGQVSDFQTSVNSEPAKADQKTAGIIDQFTQAGMYGSIDGYVELHGNKKGAAIIKLRNGKLALLVPHMESEAFIKRQSRRVDYIIMTMSDGKGIVVTSLEQMISENIMPG